MKTVDVVKMPKGWYVTRRWSGMNKGAEFFPSVAPAGMKSKDAKEFLATAVEAKDKFIKDWTCE